MSEKGGAESEQNNNYAVVLRVSSRVQQRGGGDDGVSKHTFRRAASSVLVATRAATGSDVDISASRQIIIIFAVIAQIHTTVDKRANDSATRLSASLWRYITRVCARVRVNNINLHEPSGA